MQTTGTNPPLSDNTRKKPKGKGKRGGLNWLKACLSIWVCAAVVMLLHVAGWVAMQPSDVAIPGGASIALVACVVGAASLTRLWRF